MSTSINEAWVQSFENRVHHLGQQEVSRARSAVRNRTGKGQIYSFERMAASDMTAYSGRHADTPINNVASSRRNCTVSTWEWGELVDNADLARILIDPDSNYMKTAAYAYGRKLDEEIFDAMVSDSKTTVGTGTGGGVGAAAPFVAGQKIGDGTGALTLDDLRGAKRKLDAAEIMGNRYCAVSAKALEDLLKITEVTSIDYNVVKALVNGELNTYLGFDFIRTELVPGASADNVTGQGTMCWVDSSMGLAISDDKFTRVGPDASKKFSNRIYCETTFGVARIEDEGVVLIDRAAT